MRWLVTSLLSALAVTGCGTGDTSTSASTTSAAPTPPGHGLIFTVTVHLTGASPVDTSLRDHSITAVSSCKDWAETGVAGLLTIPGAGTPADNLSYAAIISGFHGPGDYTATSNLLALNSGGVSFSPVQGTSALRTTIRGDGSGLMDITAFQDIADSSKQESGQISWKCAPAP